MRRTLPAALVAVRPAPRRAGARRPRRRAGATASRPRAPTRTSGPATVAFAVRTRARHRRRGARPGVRLGERHEGDAARRLPAGARRARAGAAAVRPQPADADDPLVLQQGRVAGQPPARPGRAGRARAARRDDRRSRRCRSAGAARGSPRATRRGSSCASTGCCPRRHRAYGMGLLERVVPRQRWGVALAAPQGWRLYFKGGWTRRHRPPGRAARARPPPRLGGGAHQRQPEPRLRHGDAARRVPAAAALAASRASRQTVRSVTRKPAAAALARMPWTVGPSSLQAPAHRRETMPSALPVRLCTSGPPESPQWIGPDTS